MGCTDCIRICVVRRCHSHLRASFDDRLHGKIIESEVEKKYFRCVVDADIFTCTNTDNYKKFVNDFHLGASITNSLKHSPRSTAVNGHQACIDSLPMDFSTSTSIQLVEKSNLELFSMAMYSCRDCRDYFQDSSEMRTKRFKNECKFTVARRTSNTQRDCTIIFCIENLTENLLMFA